MPTVDPPAILINGETRAILSARDRGLKCGGGNLETSAREVFRTDRVIDPGPVTRADDCSYAIGPVSRALQDRLDEKNLAISD